MSGTGTNTDQDSSETTDTYVDEVVSTHLVKLCMAEHLPFKSI